MEAKACIFDFDGVVIDSEKYHHQAWEKVAHIIGVDFPYEEYMPLKSAGRQVVIPYLFNKANKTLTPELYQKYYDIREAEVTAALSNLSEKDVTPGLIDFLALLHKNGIVCSVASSSALAHVTAKRFGLYNLFDAFVDGELHLPNKPAPDLFLHAASLLNTAPQQCVVFEDSINGLRAAKNANMKCVGIQTHFTDIADKIIDDFVGADLSLLHFGG